jgi:hypothetical protein
MLDPMIPIVPLVRVGMLSGWRGGGCRGGHQRNTLRLLSAALVFLLLLSVIEFIGPA